MIGKSWYNADFPVIFFHKRGERKGRIVKKTPGILVLITNKCLMSGQARLG